jgi:hypothetical protein
MFTFVIRTAPGSAAGTKTPIACGGNTSPRSKSARRSLKTAVEFHKSCMVNDSNYDADHFNGRFVVTP